MPVTDQRSRWILTCVALLFPCLLGAALCIRTDTDNIQNWLPADTEQRAKYDRFVSMFGHDDEIIVSWPGCTIDDPRLAELSHRLTRSPKSIRLFSSVTSGREVLDYLSGKRFSYSYNELRVRLSGIFFETNGETTPLIVQLTPEGQQNGEMSVRELQRQIAATPGLTLNEVRIAGETVTTVEIDRATKRALWFSGPAMLMAVIVALMCLRTLKLVLIAVAVASFAALTSVALVAICGLKFNGLLVMMPMLVLVLTLSALFHLCGYYRQAVCSRDADPVSSMIGNGWRPCTLAMLTTAIGMLMLCASQIPAVRLFGGFSALALVFATGYILLIFPAAISCWPTDTRPGVIGSVSKYFVKIGWQKSNVWLARWSMSIVIGSLVMCFMFSLGLPRIRSTLQTNDMFAASAKVPRDYNWLQARFPLMQSVEILVSFPQAAPQADLVSQVRKLKLIQDSFASLPEVKSSLSIANFCRLPDRTRSASSLLQADLINEGLHGEFDLLVGHRLAARDERNVTWRIRLGLEADHHLPMKDLRGRFEQLASETIAALDSTASVAVSGIWPLTIEGRSLLFRDLTASFLWAFVIIAVIVMCVLKSICGGFIAMVPNLAPTVIFFGALGWSGVRIDVSTILTAAVGLGIALDDTMHYLHEFVKGTRREGLSRQESAVRSLRRCCRPMVYTTLVCCAGLIPFAFSEFLPARQFSLAIIGLLSLALLGDLILLPALLISPLGRLWGCTSPAPSLQYDVVPRGGQAA